jgi:nucleoid-associated protein YgaU
MALAKLMIEPLPPSRLKPIKAPFNPNTYTVVKPVMYDQTASSPDKKVETERKKNAPTLSFSGGGSRQITLDLFFDVTEPIDGVKYEDVRELTNQIVALTRIERDLSSPPWCKISWGHAPSESDFPFIGVVNNLTQSFTLFDTNGSPLRANLSVAFTEFLPPLDDKRKTDPELTTRLVKRGDSLSGIAGEVYRAPTLWRLIAEANDLDDPRRLPIGARLRVPKRG